MLQTKTQLKAQTNASGKLEFSGELVFSCGPEFPCKIQLNAGKLKKALTVLLLLFLALLSLGATQSRFQLSKGLDIGLAAGSTALVGANYAWEKNQAVPTYSGTPAVALDSLNFLDRSAIFQYNATLDKAGTLSTLALLAAPGAFIFTTENSLTYGLMYFETIATTYGLKELCKNLVVRQRPYLYSADYPAQELENGDYNRSFLSGHTALAFASATYLTTVLTADFKNSAFRFPVIVASYTLASAIATTRVLSGNHYLTDVFAGALLGSLCGLAIPLLHTINSNTDGTLSAQITPAGVCFGVRL